MSKASCCNETEVVTQNGIEVKGSWHNIVLSDQIKESTNKHQQQQLYQAQEKGRGWGGLVNQCLKKKKALVL